MSGGRFDVDDDEIHEDFIRREYGFRDQRRTGGVASLGDFVDADVAPAPASPSGRVADKYGRGGDCRTSGCNGESAGPARLCMGCVLKRADAECARSLANIQHQNALYAELRDGVSDAREKAIEKELIAIGSNNVKDGMAAVKEKRKAQAAEQSTKRVAPGRFK